MELEYLVALILAITGGVYILYFLLRPEDF